MDEAQILIEIIKLVGPLDRETKIRILAAVATFYGVKEDVAE